MGEAGHYPSPPPQNTPQGGGNILLALAIILFVGYTLWANIKW